MVFYTLIMCIIECFTNANWTGSKENRRSTIGYYISVGGNLVS